MVSSPAWRGRVRVFKNKAFARFARKAEISDATPRTAMRDAERGLIAANLGGSIIKQRIARPGKGKSGGFRILMIFKAGLRAFFVHSFAKNEKDIIGKDELAALKKIGSELPAYDAMTLARAVASGTLMEIICDEKAIS
jgi:hypothetical protein